MQASELHAVSLALRTARNNQTPIEPPTKTWPALDAEWFRSSANHRGEIDLERGSIGWI